MGEGSAVTSARGDEICVVTDAAGRAAHARSGSGAHACREATTQLPEPVIGCYRGSKITQRQHSVISSRRWPRCQLKLAEIGSSPAQLGLTAILARSCEHGVYTVSDHDPPTCGVRDVSLSRQQFTGCDPAARISRRQRQAAAGGTDARQQLPSQRAGPGAPVPGPGLRDLRIPLHSHQRCVLGCSGRGVGSCSS